MSIEFYNRSIIIFPNDHILYHCRGMSFYKNKNYLKAKNDFKKATELNPNFEESKKMLKETDKILFEQRNVFY